MLYSLIKFKKVTDRSLVLTPWKQHLKRMIEELQVLQADRHDIGIQYIEPRELDVRIYFYNSNYRETFIRTNVINGDKGILALWLPDPLIKVDKPFDYTFKPKTDDVKAAMNSIYGVKNMKKLIDTDSIYISTAGYEPTLSWAGVDYKPIYSLYKSMLGDNEPFTFEYKEDKNLDRVIRHVQVNEKKKVVTIVWKDGEVTMAKCGPNDMWDPEKGVLVCVAKRFFNSNTQFSKWLKSVIPEEENDTKSLLDKIAEGITSKYQPKHSATE